MVKNVIAKENKNLVCTIKKFKELWFSTKQKLKYDSCNLLELNKQYLQLLKQKNACADLESSSKFSITIQVQEA